MLAETQVILADKCIFVCVSVCVHVQGFLINHVSFLTVPFYMRNPSKEDTLSNS